MRQLSIQSLDQRAQALAVKVLGDYPPPEPFWIWAQSIGLAEHIEPLGGYCRQQSHLPVRLRELSVLIAGRHNRSPFAWHAHFDSAIAAGVSREALERLAGGEEPGFTAPDEDVTWRFCRAVLEDHRVGDALFDETKRTLGIEGLIDLVGCLGSFSMSAWAVNVFEVGLNEEMPWPFPDTVRPVA